MVILIVDDQTNVVSGIISGIDWVKIGVSKVLKAYNAHEAKDILQSQPVDIMLCDIEMPVEDGLSLLRWVNKEAIPVECIFLTAHADFMYAREAISLGGFDYILQPARYEDIENVIVRAQQEIFKKREQREYSSYGKTLYSNKGKLLNEIVRGWCLHREADLDGVLEDLGRLEIEISGDSALYLVLVQVHHWLAAKEGGDACDFFSVLSGTIAGDLAHYGQKTLLAELDDSHYIVVIYADHNRLIDEQGMVRQLEHLLRTLEEKRACLAACYTGAAVHPDAVPMAMARLMRMGDDNVACSSRVFLREDVADAGVAPYDFSKIRLWAELLLNGGWDLVRKEIRLLLDELSSGDRLNAENLKRFYQSFMQTAFNVAEQKNIPMQKLFDDKDVLDRSIRAYETVEDMVAFSDYVINFLAASSPDESGGDLVGRISRYVSDHIDGELKRDDIAKIIFLNPDYMSRLFKKEAGMPLKRYIMECKMKKAQVLLKTTSLRISEVAGKVGYGNFSHFSQVYKDVIGRTPAQDR
jgi:two-component system, response regulator YesN